jgi:hypothetical protein
VLEDRAALNGWALFLLASTAAAALTPQLIHGLLFPFGLLVMGSIRNIGEWAPADLTHLTPFPIALLCLMGLSATGRLKLPPWRILILLGVSYLALSHVRHQMLFGVIAPMLVAPALRFDSGEKPLPSWLAPAGLALLMVMIVARVLVPTMRGDDRVTPMTALQHVPLSLRAQPVLNHYDFGGYLIFAGVRPFVDGRTDMYGDAFLADYDRMMRPNRQGLADGLAHWHIAWTLLPPGPAARMMDTMPGWHRSYSDAVAVIHVRD